MHDVLVDNRLRRAVIPDMLTRNAGRHSSKPAVIERSASGSRRVVSYGEMNNYVNSLANRWIADGLTPGSVVAGIGRNGADLVAAYLAALRCGCSFTMLNHAHTDVEIDFPIGHCNPAVGATRSTDDRDVLAGHGSRITTFDGLLESSLVQRHDEPDVFIDDSWTAAIVYTSGTESRPKGVEITHRNFMIATTPAWSYEGYLRNEDVFLLLAPIHTMAGIGTVTNAMSMGATMVVLDSTDPEVVIAAIESERVTNMSQTPTFYRRMVESERFDQADLGSLQQCHTYGGLNQANVFNAFVDKVPGLWWATYWGQSELSQLGSIGWFRRLEDIPGGDLRWIGKPTAHLEVRIVDDDGQDAEVGEMVVRSPAVMRGYRDDPARTAEAVRGGWLHTGDIVRRDADLNLYFYDRKKDVVKTGGMNVSSLEVEQAVLEVSGVLEVAVIGVPDEKWSEAVVACVVTRADAQVDEQEIIAHCKARLASYKVPKRVVFRNDLPKDLQGKIRKRLLRDEL
ncbi:MAG: class I adenylate-forming enzyme family protein [Ilumatobacteraceae bacterium]